MSRLFGELSGRRSDDRPPDDRDGHDTPPPARTPQPGKPPESGEAARAPIESALRHEIDRLRQELDRQKALGRDRDQVLQERENKSRAQVEDLDSARQRIAVLEDRQRQFAEKIKATDSELRDARQDAKDAKEALEYERHLREADAARVGDLESESAVLKAERAKLEQVKAELTSRVAGLKQEAEERSRLLETELRNSRERVTTLEDRQRQMAEKLRSVEPAVQAAQAEASQARTALVARQAALGQAESQCQTLSEQLAEARRSVASAQEAHKAAVESSAREQAALRAGFEKRVSDVGQQGESRAAALLAELSAARQRVETLEDRQRQMVVKVTATDKELAAARAAAQQAAEAVERGKHLHEATLARLAETEARLAAAAEARTALEENGTRQAALCTDLERRLAALSSEKDTQAKTLETELKAAKDRVAVLEDRQRQMAEKLRSVEPSVQSARDDARQAREALVAAEGREKVALSRLAEADAKLKAEAAARLALEKENDALAGHSSDLEKKVASGADAAAGKIQTLEADLKTSRERVAVLEDRQRQFAEKIRVNEGEKQGLAAAARNAQEALDREKELHAAAEQRLAEVEARARTSEEEMARRTDAAMESEKRLEIVKAELYEALRGKREAEATAVLALERSEHELGGRCAELERKLRAALEDQEQVSAQSGRRIADLEQALAASRQEAASGLRMTGDEIASLKTKFASAVSDLSRERQLREAAEKERSAHESALAEAEALEATLKAELVEARKAVEQVETSARAALERSGNELAARCAELERKYEIVVNERDRLTQEREDQTPRTAARISELEDRNKQFAEKIRSDEAALQASVAEAQELRRRFEREEKMRMETSGRLSDLEAEVLRREEAHAAQRAGEKSETEARLAGLEKRLAEEVGRHAADDAVAKEAAEQAARMVSEVEGRCRELERRLLQAESGRRDLQKQVKELEEAAARDRKVRSDMGGKLARYERELDAAAGAGPAGWRRRLAGASAGSLFGGLVAVLAVGFLAGFLQRPSGTVTETPTVLPRVGGERKAGPEQPVQPKPQPIEWPALLDAGVQVTSAENARTIVFDKGVFVRYAEIGLPARDSLRALAAQMKPFLGRLRLEVEGHTDSDPLIGHPTFVDNKALGQARADAVLAFLRDDCGLPAASLVATSAGPDRPPFANDTLDGKRRNRTVVLYLRPVPAQ